MGTLNDLENELQLKRDYEQRLTDYTNVLRERAGDKKLEDFCKLRQFSMETVKDAGIFYIGDATEMLVPSYLNVMDTLGVISQTNNRPIFHDRWVIPIKTREGLVQNLVGYSPNADERYIYGTSAYYRRRDTLYGLENLGIAYNLGYAIITEGITDTICLRNLGYKNSFAMCGTHSSDYIINMLNRCKYGVIRIPDRDDAGKRALKGWTFKKHVTINVYLKYKDVDEMCRESLDNREWVMEYLNASIDILKESSHNGLGGQCLEVTML